MTEKTSFSRRKEVLFIAILAALPLLGLFAVEGGLRLYLRLMYGAPGHSYGLWRYDKELGARQAEYGYNTLGLSNNYGFRDDEDVFEPKPRGSLRIITVGGSSTYCYNLLQHETWPYRLEQQLRTRRRGGEKDQVLNAGGVMWSIGHIYARAKKDIPALRPDYVVIYSGVNEESNAFYLSMTGQKMEDLVNTGTYGVFSRNLEQNKWLSRNWVSYKILERYVIVPIHDLRFRNVVGAAAPITQPEPEPHLLQNYLAVLRSLIGLTRENGGQVIFVTEITGNPTYGNLRLTSYSRAGAKLASELGAIVVDPSPLLETAKNPMDLFYYTGIHLSKFGAEQLAEYIFEKAFSQSPQRTAALSHASK